jgi:hypothetical protein
VAPGATLNPGQSASVTAVFSDSSNVAIQFAPSVAFQ